MNTETLLCLFRDKRAYIVESELENNSLLSWLQGLSLLQTEHLNSITCNKCIEDCASLPLHYEEDKIYFLCPDNYLQGEQYIEEADRIVYKLNIQRLLELYCKANNIKRAEEYHYNRKYQTIGINLNESVIHLLTYKHLDISSIQEIREITRDYKNVHLLTIEQIVQQNTVDLLPSKIKPYSFEELFKNRSLKFIKGTSQPKQDILLSIYLDTRKAIYKGQEVNFNRKKTLFLWLSVLAQVGNKGLTHKEVSDKLQDGMLRVDQISVNRTRVLNLFKEQTNINQSELSNLIINQDSNLKLNVPLNQIEIIER